MNEYQTRGEIPLHTTSDGHIRLSREEFTHAIRARYEEPAEDSMAGQIIDELESRGMHPGTLSEEPGSRVVIWYW